MKISILKYPNTVVSHWMRPLKPCRDVAGRRSGMNVGSIMCPWMILLNTHIILCSASLVNSRPILLNLDPVNVSWRPLIFYAAVTTINFVIRSSLQHFWSLRHSSYGSLEYLLHNPPSWNPETDARPIVLLHGLGLGLLQYSHLIFKLIQEFPDRPILIILQPHISQEFFHSRFLEPLSALETTDSLSGLMRELGWVQSAKEGQRSHGVTMFSHSKYIPLGSFLRDL
jgi:hypothetical protein